MLDTESPKSTGAHRRSHSMQQPHSRSSTVADDDSEDEEDDGEVMLIAKKGKETEVEQVLMKEKENVSALRQRPKPVSGDEMDTTE